MDSTLDLNTFDSLIASYNEESFVASEIEVHPINEDPVISVDEDHGYVPNLPLLREEYIDAPFGPPRGQELTTSEDVQQSRKANECSGFSVRVGQTKKSKSDQVTHKYLRCNKADRPQSKRTFDTLDESFMSVRNMSFQVTDCKAHIFVQVIEATSTFVIYKFVECHNHPLVETYNQDFTKAGRKLSFSTKQFMHHMTLNNIGPTIAHRLQVSMKGGHLNVNGTPIDFKNFSQAIRLFIGNRDSQLLLDRLRDRVKNLPYFFFDFSVVKGELRHVLWADEISRKKYEVFGDVLASDATYYTNKYNMIFVPFTGVDHHKNCVTFGAVHPINDDPILSVDEDDGYVPNLSLIHEECYEIPSNGDLDDHLVFPPEKEVTTSDDVQQSRKANVVLLALHIDLVNENVVYSATHHYKDNDVTDNSLPNHSMCLAALFVSTVAPNNDPTAVAKFSVMTNLIAIKIIDEEGMIVDEPFLSEKEVQIKRKVQQGVEQSSSHSKKHIPALENQFLFMIIADAVNK
ncbi:hypothetical protein E3N88_37870 [Mikania micrantha]|uniref:FAR1 domain-containing protein n=1 Tax=Mikania micrantha TaxID=192012 RepID=A0A5N6LSF1_9ASTR|nr:hypothetical protein E3N88_37870 [Mikania micrantha]